jgi:porphobilinogen deaminase
MPIGAHATLAGTELRLRAVSFLHDKVRRAESRGPASDAAGLGEKVAEQLK